MLQAGARVLTLDQLEGLKVRWLTGWGPRVFKSGHSGLGSGAALHSLGRLQTIALNHFIHCPLTPRAAMLALHCRTPACPAGQMRLTVMATRRACGPPTACSQALPSLVALAIQVGCCCSLLSAYAACLEGCTTCTMMFTSSLLVCVAAAAAAAAAGPQRHHAGQLAAVVHCIPVHQHSLRPRPAIHQL